MFISLAVHCWFVSSDECQNPCKVRPRFTCLTPVLLNRKYIFSSYLLMAIVSGSFGKKKSDHSFGFSSVFPLLSPLSPFLSPFLSLISFFLLRYRSRGEVLKKVCSDGLSAPFLKKHKTIKPCLHWVSLYLLFDHLCPSFCIASWR